MAVYGYFDENPRWEEAMERDYLKMNCLAFDDWVGGKAGPKGCVARLFSECKKEIIKAINRYGDGSHSGRIRMKRTPEEVLLLGKYKKRKKGTTLGGFYSLSMDGDTVTPKEIVEQATVEELHGVTPEMEDIDPNKQQQRKKKKVS